ncbi:hypothetical protein DFH08DRAFT_972259 [Mycena albidolilacea]|uniref:Uncharacterized protein n=1 Tax=Mycena albidolilacea TaxID=1033008 RepID=A0AAD7EF43_9AGAR|nr:hypothetical protein DFH08DRAFT_972259 [Mycena albidolilacea]
MPSSRIFKTHEDHLRYLLRLQSYREYRARNREKCRQKGRERMARLRAKRTEEQRARNRDIQAQYRERYREHIAHRARRKSAQENAVDGRVTKPRPKARHYWSADELDSDSSEESEGENEW